jgi:hypothetical protein
MENVLLLAVGLVPFTIATVGTVTALALLKDEQVGSLEGSSEAERQSPGEGRPALYVVRQREAA